MLSFCVKNWSKFFFSKLLFSLQKEEEKKNKKKNKHNDPIIVLKTGPIMLRNILGPILTQPWTNV